MIAAVEISQSFIQREDKFPGIICRQLLEKRIQIGYQYFGIAADVLLQSVRHYPEAVCYVAAGRKIIIVFGQ